MKKYSFDGTISAYVRGTDVKLLYKENRRILFKNKLAVLEEYDENQRSWIEERTVSVIIM